MTNMSALQSTIASSNVATTSLQNGALFAELPNLLQTISPLMPQQSTIVTIGAIDSKLESTYSIPRTPFANALPKVWQMYSNDAVSSLMAGNFLSNSIGDRLRGIGSAMLDMLQSGTNGFTQSVSRSSSESLGIASPNAQSPIAEQKLVVQTKSGIDIEIVLGSRDDRLEVSLTSSGDLSEAERIALGNLSDAFQEAIDGLSAKPPVVNLVGLTQFDSTVLSSVDFHSNITLDEQGPQSLHFRADSTTRTLNLNGPVGTLNVSVDMRDSSVLGSPKQRTAAINSYLKQFDQAASRGHVDNSLMVMFKAAFTQMNDYVAPALQQPEIVLADVDHAMLTGLGDFNASVKQIPIASNPKNLNELDTFSYEASQTTTVLGTNQFNRSVSQQQQSRLTASYHLPITANVPLNLTTEQKSQNYYYKQIDDRAESSVEFAYIKGVLSQAFAMQSASQSTRTSKYEMGKLMEDTTTPFKATLNRDILATLKPFLEDLGRTSRHDDSAWHQRLSEVNDQIFLQSDPAHFGSKGLRMFTLNE